MFVPSPRLLTADEALRILSVRRQTLYAYVSKGWIRSVALPSSRERRYVYEDVQRVHQRALARSGHRAAASVALTGDTPLISTAISELRPDGPWYRGYSALALSKKNIPFESICHLLWEGELPPLPPSASFTLSVPHSYSRQAQQDSAYWHQQLASCFLTTNEQYEQISYEVCLAIQHFAIAYLGYLGPAQRFIEAPAHANCVMHLIHSLGLDSSPLTQQSLNLFLTLFCEHELSPSTFAIRTAASTGTSLSIALASALAVTTGRELHGVYTELSDWLQRHSSLEALQQAATQALDAGLSPPGYKHPVYRDQDARSTDLLAYLETHYSQAPAMSMLFEYVQWLAQEYGLHPHHEFACTAFGIALGLPLRTVPALFVVARLAGWIAHYQEQTEQGHLFRPRAHFLGSTHNV